MPCDRFQKELSRYVDGELAAGERAKLESHAKGCLACRQALARAHQLAGLLRKVSVPPVPAGLTAQVMALAGQLIASRPASPWAPYRLLQWWTSVPLSKRLAAVAVFALGLTAGLVMGHQLQRESLADARQNTPSADEDPVAAYDLDYLGSEPEGSLPQVYLTLLSTPDESREQP